MHERVFCWQRGADTWCQRGTRGSKAGLGICLIRIAVVAQRGLSGLLARVVFVVFGILVFSVLAWRAGQPRATCRGSRVQQKDREEHDGVEGCILLRRVKCKRSGKKLDHTWRQFGREPREGFPYAARPANMMVQQPSKMAHAREQWSALARLNRDRTILSRESHVARDPLYCRACTASYTRVQKVAAWLEDVLSHP